MFRAFLRVTLTDMSRQETSAVTPAVRQLDHRASLFRQILLPLATSEITGRSIEIKIPPFC